MSSNSTVVPSSAPKHPRNFPPKVVIVKPNSTALNYDGITLGSKFKNSGLVLLQNTTHFSFNFNGTGVAVFAMDHPFPPIPDQFLPRWTCSVDNTTIPASNSSAHKDKDKSDIPSDKKTRVCEANQLPPGQHNLQVQIDIPSLPAYFHSIRYKPTDDSSVRDALLRIDAKDQTAISYNPKCWDHNDDQLQSKCINTNSTMNIKFYGQSFDWFGSSKDTSKLDLKLTLDNKDIHLKGHDFDNANSLFTISASQVPQQHNLTILTSHGQLSLDHLLVKVGNPMYVRLGSNEPPSQPSGPTSTISTDRTPIVIGAIIGSIVGLILVGLIVYLVIRCIRGRRRRNSWKDSALPPAMLHPASRVSSRSSFSREVVTGDIEYNPEAQKKLESASMTSITEPPAAIILHADSGLRIQIPASEVPPCYTQV